MLVCSQSFSLQVSKLHCKFSRTSDQTFSQIAPKILLGPPLALKFQISSQFLINLTSIFHAIYPQLPLQTAPTPLLQFSLSTPLPQLKSQLIPLTFPPERRQIDREKAQRRFFCVCFFVSSPNGKILLSQSRGEASTEIKFPRDD
jgi:hypothetical protein